MNIPTEQQGIFIRHWEELAKQADILYDIRLGYIDSGSHFPPGEYIVDDPLLLPVDYYKVNLLVSHLKVEYPQLNDWRELLKSDAPRELTRLLRNVTARRTFKGICEACPEATSPHMSLAEAIDKYLEFHRNSSPRTQGQYSSVLNRLAEELHEIPIRPEPIEQFLSQFRGDLTRLNYFKIIRFFFRWLEEREGISNPTDKMKAPKLKKRVVPSLSMDEFTRLLDQPISARDKAAIMLLGGCGLRVGEAINLTFEHIHENTLTVPEEGKTGERTVPLAPNIRQALLSLKNGHKPNDPIFWGTHPIQPLGHQGFLNLVRNAFKLAGIEGKKASPHTLRHSFGRIWCSQGGNVSQLQRIFGHTNLGTTQKYIYLDDKDVRQGYERYSPFANISDKLLVDEHISPTDQQISPDDPHITL